MKASDLFVRCLEAEGVERIFGVPGEENADLMISLNHSPIDFILCRHEQAAAFMADAHGRATGKAGVCLATLGPGATNLVTGLADANMDRAPVVAIIGQGSTRRLHKESHQNMDALAMFRPISKSAQGIFSAATIPEIVRKTFKTAEAEKPGVAVMELPEDVAKDHAGEESQHRGILESSGKTQLAPPGLMRQPPQLVVVERQDQSGRKDQTLLCRRLMLQGLTLARP